MKRFSISLAAACLVPLIYWVGGFDFNERGFAAVTCVFFSLYVFFMGMIYPYSKEN